MKTSHLSVLFGFSLLGLCGALPPLQAALPSGAKVIADVQDVLFDVFEERNGESVAATRVKVQVPLPGDVTTVRFQFRASTETRPQLSSLEPVVTGKASGAKAAGDDLSCTLELNFANKTTERLSLLPAGGNMLGDGFFQLPGNFKLYTRPNLTFYKDPLRAQVLSRWESFPAASTHLVSMELRRNGASLELWAEGRLLQTWPTEAALASMSLSVPRGGAIRSIHWSKTAASLFRPVPSEALQVQEGGRTGAVVSIGAGDAVVEGIPMRVVTGANALPVAGLGRLSCPSDDLVSFYWRRSAFDGLPESRIISVPAENYAFAHVLCAADPGADTVPAFTLRLTRYANGRGGAMADSLVSVPELARDGTQQKNGPEDSRLVGTLTLGEGTAQRKVPLWLVRVPLKTGLIQDLLNEDESKYGFSGTIPAKRYLDLEILDPVKGVVESQAFPPSLKPVGRSYVPGGAQSSVLVCGLTLEVAPAVLTVRSKGGVSAFYREDAPALEASIHGASGAYTLAWDFADTNGSIVGSGKKEISLSVQKPDTICELPVASLQNGWYAARVRLLDAAGRELSDNRSSFVILPPDTRKAGFESPPRDLVVSLGARRGSRLRKGGQVIPTGWVAACQSAAAFRSAHQGIQLV